ncbi:predicted GPI-anchored protein 58 [Panicum virgatum]|uniref:predicted GPI-anchored protein 58 n=1 Tax=Panicum virgatum TaxID=38727 RepID=UPI0019D5346D|nr:predicted GPI-anchored protein 58 [Panicum virgatum]
MGGKLKNYTAQITGYKRTDNASELTLMAAVARQPVVVGMSLDAAPNAPPASPHARPAVSARSEPHLVARRTLCLVGRPASSSPRPRKPRRPPPAAPSPAPASPSPAPACLSARPEPCLVAVAQSPAALVAVAWSPTALAAPPAARRPEPPCASHNIPLELINTPLN